MAGDPLDDLKVILPPLLQSLEALELVARFFDPPQFGAVLAQVGAPEAPLAEALPRLAVWPDALSALASSLEASVRAALAGFSGLREASELGEVFRALGQLPQAQEALYPLAEGMAPVSRYFLDSAARADPALQARAMAPRNADAGVFHYGNERGGRGGYSVYVPEFYAADRPWPLVVALHGGSGHGRAFLWTWLRAARTHGAILVAPTSVGGTWALTGPDLDSPNLARALETVEARWNVDGSRRLLTGMSDGGTFTYLCGLAAEPRFTHLAPVAAAFHPMLAAFAGAERLKGLPVYLTHGALDWMFPVESARMARDILTAAGADVTYRELANLSHAYPREENPAILDWMAARPAQPPVTAAS